jgi:hypothetical protein
MLTIYPANEASGLTMVSGEIETDTELRMAEEIFGINYETDSETGVIYRFQHPAKGQYVTWMVKA